MPTILRLNGIRVVTYPNDHEPVHFHVVGPGWEAIVDLADLKLRETSGCSKSQGRIASRIVADHRELLAAAWRKWHGRNTGR